MKQQILISFLKKTLFYVFNFFIIFYVFLYSNYSFWSWNNISWLVISEIYFEWSDEWIEIYNNSNNNFSWNFSISWVKNNIVNINTKINWNDFILLWDNLNNIIDKTKIIKTWLNLLINDNKNLDVKLLYSGFIIDELTWNKNFIENLWNSKSSIQKIKTWWIFYITWWNACNSFNLIPWFYWNPWKIYNYNDILSGTQSSWTIQNIYSNYKLILSEVFFDGFYEWVEISNVWTWNFSWDLKIFWAWNNPILISGIVFSGNESKIISQKDNTFLDKKYIFKSWVSITIADDSDIALSLYYWSELFDIFQVDDYFVKKYNDKKISFEKIKDKNWQYITTISTWNRNFNISSGYVANPWKIFSYSWNVIDMSTWAESTWTNTTWTNNNWNTGLCITNSWILQITEIYKWNSDYSNFIEVYWEKQFSWVLIFSWDLLNSSFFVSINIKTWEYYLFTNDITKRISIINKKNINSLSLKNQWWNISLQWINWKIYDNVKITKNLSDWSSFYKTNKNICNSEFNKEWSFSPWFNEQFLIYFEHIECPVCQVCHSCPSCDPNVICENYNTWNNSSNCNNTWWNVETSWENFTWNNNTWENYTWDNLTWNNFTWDVIWSWNNNWSWNNQTWENSTWDYNYRGKILITNVIYDPEWSDYNREVIRLKSKLSFDVDLSDFRIVLDTRDTAIRLHWILKAWEESDFTWNYRLPNKVSVKMDLFRYLDYISSYSYDVNDNNINFNSTWEVSNLNFSLKIQNIDYNPEWSDYNNEKITIKLFTWNNVNLSNLKLAISDWWDWVSLFNHNLNSGNIIHKNEEKTIIWNFRFPNSRETCVYLYSWMLKIDTYCYNPNTWNNISSDLKLRNFKFRIDDIVYNPKWSDIWKEKITITFLWWADEVDLKYFWLSIWRGHSVSFFKKKYWKIKIWQTKTLIGTFWFPNWKDTCVYFRPNSDSSIIYDKLCYTIKDDNNLNKNDYVNTKIHLTYVEYDPKWNDKWKEYVNIILLWWREVVDLSDWFYLRIWWKRKVYLKKYWKIKIWEVETLMWTFWFPNNKPTTVELCRWNLIFYTTFYTPSKKEKKEKPKEVKKTWNVVNLEIYNYSNISFKILDIFPDPKWNDRSKEFIDIKYLSWIYNEINLKDFYLTIWARKVYLKKYWKIKKWEIKNLKWTFWFPNTSICVWLWAKKNKYDEICYYSKEWYILYQDGTKKYIENKDNSFISSILKKIKLKKNKKTICATYLWKTASCKKISENNNYYLYNNLYKSYRILINSYLKNSWFNLFYNSRVKNYNELFLASKKKLKNWVKYENINWKKIRVDDLVELSKYKYPDLSTFLTKNIIELAFWELVYSKWRNILYHT